MFYVEIKDNLITGKGEGDFKTEEQIEVSEDIYAALTSIPAEYEEAGGEIISVTPYPIPEPPPLIPKEQREHAYESSPIIDWEGGAITVDQANTVYLRYAAEGSLKATEIQALIIAAKESIRQMYPDEDEQD